MSRLSISEFSISRLKLQSGESALWWRLQIVGSWCWGSARWLRVKLHLEDHNMMFGWYSEDDDLGNGDLQARSDRTSLTDRILRREEVNRFQIATHHNHCYCYDNLEFSFKSNKPFNLI